VSFVLDSSVVATWVFGDEVSAATDHLARRLETDVGVAPAMFPFELGNVLLLGLRRGRLKAELVVGQLERLAGMSIEIEEPPSGVTLLATWRVANDHRLTFYDASYLELALRRGLPLATLDAELIAACAVLGHPRLPE
jgi:predicted nucleic acid-binding protein